MFAASHSNEWKTREKETRTSLFIIAISTGIEWVLWPFKTKSQFLICGKKNTFGILCNGRSLMNLNLTHMHTPMPVSQFALVSCLAQPMRFSFEKFLLIWSFNWAHKCARAFARLTRRCAQTGCGRVTRVLFAKHPHDTVSPINNTWFSISACNTVVYDCLALGDTFIQQKYHHFASSKEKKQSTGATPTCDKKESNEKSWQLE